MAGRPEGRGTIGGRPSAAPSHTVDTLVELLVAWHDDEHDGPWAFCTHRVCSDVRGRRQEDS